NTAGFIIDTLILPDGLPQLLFGGNRLQNLQNTVVDDPYNGTVVTDPSGQIETPGTVLKFLAATEGIMKVNYVGDHDLNIDFTIAGANIVDTWIRFKLRLLIYKNGFIISQDVVYQGLFNNGTGDYSATISFDYSKDIFTNINDELKFVIVWNVYD
ncbi:MAG: hypothetical protein ACK55I_11845, partial [bacterium]